MDISWQMSGPGCHTPDLSLASVEPHLLLLSYVIVVLTLPLVKTKIDFKEIEFCKPFFSRHEVPRFLTI